MCVIILRNPGIVVPFEKLESACVVNPDGWGISVADRGRLLTTKGVGAKTDPEEIARMLEDAKDQPLMLHLRFNTVGARNIDNCHPFTTMKRDDDGVDLAFSHNGTLYSWKEQNSEYSDSYWLNEQFCKPLFKRILSYTGEENLLKDPFAISLLEDTAGSTSLFGFIDGNGVQLAINHSNGHEHEGWWSSNNYSFNQSHRKKVTTVYPSPSYDQRGVNQDYKKNTTGWTAAGQEDFWNKTVFHADGSVTEAPSSTCPFDAADQETVDENPKLLTYQEAFEQADLEREKEIEDLETEELMEQGERIAKVASAMPKRLNENLAKALLAEKRVHFVDVCKIDSLSEMTRFDPDDLSELVLLYPESATLLLLDLLQELYIRDVRKAA